LIDVIVAVGVGKFSLHGGKDVEAVGELAGGDVGSTNHIVFKGCL